MTRGGGVGYHRLSECSSVPVISEFLNSTRYGTSRELGHESARMQERACLCHDRFAVCVNSASEVVCGATAAQFHHYGACEGSKGGQRRGSEADPQLRSLIYVLVGYLSHRCHGAALCRRSGAHGVLLSLAGTLPFLRGGGGRRACAGIESNITEGGTERSQRL